MNPELKAKWITALKSGKYPKDRECLREVDNTYCCLGVLCDVIDPNKWVNYSYDGSSEYLPSKMSDELGLENISPREFAGITLLACSHQRALAEINDKTDDFERVIEYIEKVL